MSLNTFVIFLTLQNCVSVLSLLTVKCKLMMENTYLNNMKEARKLRSAFSVKERPLF